MTKAPSFRIAFAHSPLVGNAKHDDTPTMQWLSEVSAHFGVDIVLRPGRFAINAEEFHMPPGSRITGHNGAVIVTETGAEISFIPGGAMEALPSGNNVQ